MDAVGFLSSETSPQVTVSLVSAMLRISLICIADVNRMPQAKELSPQVVFHDQHPR